MAKKFSGYGCIVLLPTPSDNLCRSCAVCTSVMPSIKAGKQEGRYFCAPSPQCSTASSNTHTAFHLRKGMRTMGRVDMGKRGVCRDGVREGW